ncbi:MAG: SRPBCC family protein [Actinomycetota bacterium]
MRRLWVHRTIDARPEVLWRLLTDPAQWPTWGPTVREAEVDGGRLAEGSTGSVTSVVGVSLPFQVTEYVECRRWAWKVAGVDATDHTVEPVGLDRCRVGFGVPWPFAPYLAVCRLALGKLEATATGAASPAEEL